ncbi:MAG: hypothetical protein LBR54_02630 [Oscillospiraceae bacterium]|jgi:hypothetical protein|nr:hypothetical protein [Oscillospiraceae bacterium]
MGFKDLKKELVFLAGWSVIPNAAVILVCYLVSGQFVPSLLGIAGGMFTMFADMVMLWLSLNIFLSRGPGWARAKAMSGYLLRMSVVGLWLYFAFSSPRINSFSAAVPLLYPTVLFRIRGIFFKDGV